MVTLLVGAEGITELSEVDWAREATDAEVAIWNAENPRVATKDGIGRPYWHVTVLDHAPADVLERAKTHLRVVRLT